MAPPSGNAWEQRLSRAGTETKESFQWEWQTQFELSEIGFFFFLGEGLRRASCMWRCGSMVAIVTGFLKTPGQRNVSNRFEHSSTAAQPSRSLSAGVPGRQDTPAVSSGLQAAMMERERHKEGSPRPSLRCLEAHPWLPDVKPCLPSWPLA